MKNVKGHKKSNVDMRRKKYKGYPFTQKHYHKKSNYGKRRKKYEGYSFTQSIVTKLKGEIKGNQANKE